MDQITSALDEQFAQLHARAHALVRVIPDDKLYWQPRQSAGAFPVYSCGEHLLRSARIVEQTFGGITANLWDDPFEWTLPETLTTPEAVLDYLGEVEATRRRGFDLIKTEDDLTKEIMTASGARQLLYLLLDTLVRAGH